MKIHKKHVFFAILLPLQFFLVQYLSQKSALIEKYYSNGIYPYISIFLRFLFGWIPFSFGDILGMILVALFLFEICNLFKNTFRGIILKLIQFIAFLSIAYFCFYFFWGLNYFREPLAKKLHLKQSKYTTEQLVSVTHKIIEELNQLQNEITQNDSLKVIVPYSSAEVYVKVPLAYQKLAENFPQLAYKTPSIKSSIVSLFQSYNSTSGYLNPITGEAQINNMIPKPDFLSTATHEVAHQIGWSAENDANFVGFLACIYSNDVYFNYSGYRMAFRYCMREIRKRDSSIYKSLWKNTHKGIAKDLKDNYLFWKQYENSIEPYLKKGYNSYLKANNQIKGIKSYSYVVDLLIAYFEQKKL